MFENLEAGVHIGDHEHYKNWPGRTEIQSSACLSYFWKSDQSNSATYVTIF